MTKVAFLVNGDERGAIAERARAFASRLTGRYDMRVAFRSPRKAASVIRFFAFLVRTRPALVYVFDMSYSGVLAGAMYKLITRTRLIIDTGDAIYELGRSLGRGRIKLWLTRMLEALSFRAANRLVVRGTFHQRLLEERGIQAELIPDGVDTSKFKPMDVAELRKRHGLDGVTTLGLVGSVVWNEAHGTCYGSEIAEAIRLLKDAPVKGVIIGDGPGLARLKELCRGYGIENRMLFLGRVAYDDLPRYLNLIDVCVSTQTDDAVGRVRTTGKLPLYMATGRYVLATRVGEASLCLPDEMLVDYAGEQDAAYSQRLADCVTSLLVNGESLSRGLDNIAVAQTRFDYSVLADRLAALIEKTLPARPGALECADNGGALDSSR